MIRIELNNLVDWAAALFAACWFVYMVATRGFWRAKADRLEFEMDCLKFDLRYEATTCGCPTPDPTPDGGCRRCHRLVIT